MATATGIGDLPVGGMVVVVLVVVMLVVVVVVAGRVRGGGRGHLGERTGKTKPLCSCDECL